MSLVTQTVVRGHAQLLTTQAALIPGIPPCTVVAKKGCIELWQMSEKEARLRDVVPMTSDAQALAAVPVGRKEILLVLHAPMWLLCITWDDSQGKCVVSQRHETGVHFLSTTGSPHLLVDRENSLVYVHHQEALLRIYPFESLLHPSTYSSGTPSDAPEPSRPGRPYYLTLPGGSATHLAFVNAPFECSPGRLPISERLQKGISPVYSYGSSDTRKARRKKQVTFAACIVEDGLASGRDRLRLISVDFRKRSPAVAEEYSFCLRDPAHLLIPYNGDVESGFIILGHRARLILINKGSDEPTELRSKAVVFPSQPISWTQLSPHLFLVGCLMGQVVACRVNLDENKSVVDLSVRKVARLSTSPVDMVSLSETDLVYVASRVFEAQLIKLSPENLFMAKENALSVVASFANHGPIMDFAKSLSPDNGVIAVCGGQGHGHLARMHSACRFNSELHLDARGGVRGMWFLGDDILAIESQFAASHLLLYRIAPPGGKRPRFSIPSTSTTFSSFQINSRAPWPVSFNGLVTQLDCQGPISTCLLFPSSSKKKSTLQGDLLVVSATRVDLYSPDCELLLRYDIPPYARIVSSDARPVKGSILVVISCKSSDSLNPHYVETISFDSHSVSSIAKSSFRKVRTCLSIYGPFVAMAPEFSRRIEILDSFSLQVQWEHTLMQPDLVEFANPDFITGLAFIHESNIKVSLVASCTLGSIFIFDAYTRTHLTTLYHTCGIQGLIPPRPASSADFSLQTPCIVTGRSPAIISVLDTADGTALVLERISLSDGNAAAAVRYERAWSNHIHRSPEFLEDRERKSHWTYAFSRADGASLGTVFHASPRLELAQPSAVDIVLLDNGRLEPLLIRKVPKENVYAVICTHNDEQGVPYGISLVLLHDDDAPVPSNQSPFPSWNILDSHDLPAHSSAEICSVDPERSLVFLGLGLASSDSNSSSSSRGELLVFSIRDRKIHSDAHISFSGPVYSLEQYPHSGDDTLRLLVAADYGVYIVKYDPALTSLEKLSTWSSPFLAYRLVTWTFDSRTSFDKSYRISDARRGKAPTPKSAVPTEPAPSSANSSSAPGVSSTSDSASLTGSGSSSTGTVRTTSAASDNWSNVTQVSERSIEDDLNSAPRLSVTYVLVADALKSIALLRITPDENLALVADELRTEQLFSLSLCGSHLMSSASGADPRGLNVNKRIVKDNVIALVNDVSGNLFAFDIAKVILDHLKENLESSDTSLPPEDPSLDLNARISSLLNRQSDNSQGYASSLRAHLSTQMDHLLSIRNEQLEGLTTEQPAHQNETDNTSLLPDVSHTPGGAAPDAPSPPTLSSFIDKQASLSRPDKFKSFFENTPAYPTEPFVFNFTFSPEALADSSGKILVTEALSQLSRGDSGNERASPLTDNKRPSSLTIPLCLHAHQRPVSSSENLKPAIKSLKLPDQDQKPTGTSFEAREFAPTSENTDELTNDNDALHENNRPPFPSSVSSWAKLPAREPTEAAAGSELGLCPLAVTRINDVVSCMQQQPWMQFDRLPSFSHVEHKTTPVLLSTISGSLISVAHLQHDLRLNNTLDTLADASVQLDTLLPATAASRSSDAARFIDGDILASCTHLLPNDTPDAPYDTEQYIRLVLSQV